MALPGAYKSTELTALAVHEGASTHSSPVMDNCLYTSDDNFPDEEISEADMTIFKKQYLLEVAIELCAETDYPSGNSNAPFQLSVGFNKLVSPSKGPTTSFMLWRKNFQELVCKNGERVKMTKVSTRASAIWEGSEKLKKLFTAIARVANSRHRAAYPDYKPESKKSHTEDLLQIIHHTWNIEEQRMQRSALPSRSPSRSDPTSNSPPVAETPVAETTAAETTVAERTAVERTAAETSAAETTAAERTAAETIAAKTMVAETIVAETIVAETTVAETTVAARSVVNNLMPPSALLSENSEFVNAAARILESGIDLDSLTLLENLPLHNSFADSYTQTASEFPDCYEPMDDERSPHMF